MAKIFNYDGDSSISAGDRRLALTIYNRQKSGSVDYNSKSLDEKINLTYSALSKLKKLPALRDSGETEKRVISVYGLAGLDFLKKVQDYTKRNGVDIAYKNLNRVLRRDISFHIEELKYRESLRSVS